jgi:formylglycine-generating enzyme required for sulfatase activity
MKYFTEEEMSENNITPYKFKLGEEPAHWSSYKKFSIWDCEINHKRFKECIDKKEQVFYPYFPMFITDLNIIK